MSPRSLPFALLLAHSALALASTDPEFETCKQALRDDALGRGVAAETFDTHAGPLEPDKTVLALLDYQPEFRTPIWDYLAALVDDERIRDGQAMLGQWQPVLDSIAARFGVDAATVVAVWGVESNFGRTFGKRPLLQSLGTLSCFGRRQAFFRGEFFTTLRIIQEGHIEAGKLNGSWAGAFGHTQFMPSTFMRVAIDFDGDGRRDLVDSTPDALASTANFLAEAGWRPDRPWGFEARLPSGFDASLAGRRKKRAAAEWAALGVQRADGQPLDATAGDLGLLLPAGESGPAFLTTRNFDALYAYNAAESYALAIAHLSDRLRGGAPFAQAWPTDDPGLSRSERREVQSRLAALGYDVGPVDGVIGDATRQAIRTFLATQGIESEGRAGMKLLKQLRDHAGTSGEARPQHPE